jgi:hypothetical protein
MDRTREGDVNGGTVKAADNDAKINLVRSDKISSGRKGVKEAGGRKRCRLVR